MMNNLNNDIKREKTRIYQQRYREKHRDRYNAYKRAYYQANKEKVKKWNHENYERRKRS